MKANDHQAGAKGTPVVFWKQLEVETDDPD